MPLDYLILSSSSCGLEFRCLLLFLCGLSSIPFGLQFGFLGRFVQIPFLFRTWFGSARLLVLLLVLNLPPLEQISPELTSCSFNLISLKAFGPRSLFPRLLFFYPSAPLFSCFFPGCIRLSLRWILPPPFRNPSSNFFSCPQGRCPSPVFKLQMSCTSI